MRSLLLYVILVGSPFLALFGILRAGERLTAPPAIGGRWRLDAAFVEAAAGGCAPLRLPARAALLDVSQSGRYLQLRFNDAGRTALDARLDGDTLQARWPGGPGEEGCAASAGAEVKARVVRAHGAPDRLTGAYAVPGCVGCAPLAFEAVREEPN